MKNITLDLEDLNKKSLNLIYFHSNQKKALECAGYTIDKEGFLIDNETQTKVKAEDGREINASKESSFALIGGSHVFVRNIAGFSHYLAGKDLLRFKCE